MKDEESERAAHAQQVALFRYGLVADLMHRSPEDTRSQYARMQEKAAGSYCIPGSTRTRVAVETLRGWLRLCRSGGFDALKPRPRQDAGSVRTIPTEVADLLVSIRDAHRDWSVTMVIEAAQKEHALAASTSLPPSTVHRLLSRAGVMGKAQEHGQEHSSKDRRRFSYERAGELWMSDVMHGPAVYTGAAGSRRKRKTYLIGLLDDATRVVPYCAFALAENTSAFLPVLRSAIMRRGLPLRLYVDNGSLYRSQHLALVCAKLVPWNDDS
jgi:putative transposase